MINLITGVPGSGKSAYALTVMLKEIEQGRPLFVHGIPNLKIPHTLVVCDSPTCEVCPQSPVEPLVLEELPHDSPDFLIKQYQIDERNYQKNLAVYHLAKARHDSLLRADEWHIWAPDGALLFYDEVQNVYRPVSSSAKILPSIAAFETHRHKGLDFYLVTQSPLLMNANARRLTGKHIHLRPTWAGRFQYEFPECNDNTKNTSSGVKSSYKLNSKVFSLYKSASLHTKQSKKVPSVVYVLVAVFFVFVLLAYKLSDRFGAVSNPASIDSVSAPVSLPLSNSRSILNKSKTVKPSLDDRDLFSVSKSKITFLDRLMNDFRPRLAAFVVRSGYGNISGYVEFYQKTNLVEVFSFDELHGLGIAIVKKPYGVDLVTSFDSYPVSSWYLPKPKQRFNSKLQKVASNDF